MSAPESGELSDIGTTGDLAAPSELAPLAERMMGVTGFVTNLCPPGDLRPRVFCRYYHVRRVAWTTELLLALSRDSEKLDAERARWLAWAHDLNRWPFAHNSEKGIFDQAANLPEYFAAAGIFVERDTMSAVQGIVNKACQELDAEARLVLLADMLAGFVEDPLWLVAALNVTPKVVPREVTDYLRLPLDQPECLERLVRLANGFTPDLVVEDYVQAFDAEFRRVMARVVHEHDLADPAALMEPGFEEARYLIKERFMRSVVFPYNNEHISGGAAIKREVMLPMLEQLGADAARHLTQITDEQCIGEAVARSIISEPTRYYPRLDYMQLHEPQNSFRHYLRTWNQVLM